MKDQFADLEEPKSKGPMIVLIAFGLMGIIFAFRLFTSSSHPIEGVVESIDASNATKKNVAGTNEISVRLTDGSVVVARVTSGGALHLGDEVRVMEQAPSAGGPAFEAIVTKSKP